MRELENFVQLHRATVFYISHSPSLAHYFKFCLNPFFFFYFKLWFQLCLSQRKAKLSLTAFPNQCLGQLVTVPAISETWAKDYFFGFVSTPKLVLPSSRCAFLSQIPDELFIVLRCPVLLSVPFHIMLSLLMPHPMFPASNLCYLPCLFFCTLHHYLEVINISFSTE